MVAGLLIGLVAGGTESEPTDTARDIRASLIAAAGSLEVAGIEYEEALGDRTVVNETEYEGALDAVHSSRRRYMEVRQALLVLVPELVDEIDGLYDDTGRLMEARADPTDVLPTLDQLENLLKGR